MSVFDGKRNHGAAEYRRSLKGEKEATSEEMGWIKELPHGVVEVLKLGLERRRLWSDQEISVKDYSTRLKNSSVKILGGHSCYNTNILEQMICDLAVLLNAKQQGDLKEDCFVKGLPQDSYDMNEFKELFDGTKYSRSYAKERSRLAKKDADKKAAERAEKKRRHWDAEEARGAPKDEGEG